MGYDLTIRRNSGTPITLEEWQQFIKADAEFKDTPVISAQGESGSMFEMRLSNTVSWKKHDPPVPFTFNERRGTIAVKNPSEPVLQKMLEVAQALRAVVVGEEGELYS